MSVAKSATRLPADGNARAAFAASATLLGGGELAAEVVVLPRESRQLGLDLVEELVDLAHVVALTEPDRSKALVAHVLRRQRHDLTHSLIAVEELSGRTIALA